MNRVELSNPHSSHEFFYKTCSFILSSLFGINGDLSLFDVLTDVKGALCRCYIPKNNSTGLEWNQNQNIFGTLLLFFE